MWAKLALACGRTLREYLSSVGSDELALYEALFAVEPFPDQRADLRAAMTACVSANSMRGKGKPAKLRDFLPDYWDERKQSPEEMIAIARNFAENLAVIRGK